MSFATRASVALLNLPESRILIGPWKHCMNPGFELLQEIHRFFDTYLKHLPTGLAGEPRVRYYTMNESAGGSWHTAATWPVPGARTERWYLSAGPRLQQRPPRQEAVSTFTVGTDVDCPQGGVGPFMQPCLHPGQGLAVTSEPLDHDRILTGNPVMGLRLRVDHPDANIFAYLTDVAPDGQASVITEGRLKASLRAEAPAPFAVPGTPWHRAYAEDVQPLHAGEDSHPAL